MRSVILVAAIAVLSTGAAANADPIKITEAWSRATVGAGSPGVVYFTITDSGAPDTLTGASTPAAASATIHESKNANGIMQMTPVAVVPVSADHPVKFAPGGYHVMLEGLKAPLKAGVPFTLTLDFAQAGKIDTAVTVQPLGAAAAPAPPMAGMDMSPGK